MTPATSRQILLGHLFPEGMRHVARSAAFIALDPQVLRLQRGAAFEESQFWELPLNLQADGLTEIQLSILAQSKTVVARSSFRPAAMGKQAAFVRLQSRLMELRQR